MHYRPPSALGASPRYSLYAAAYNRDTNAIRLLCRYGADIEERSGGGSTPLLAAIGWSHFEAAEALLHCGADVNAQDDRGMTAAHMMLKKGSEYEHFELLARYGARFDLPNKQGLTAAEIMSRKRDPRFRALVSASERRLRIAARGRGRDTAARDDEYCSRNSPALAVDLASRSWPERGQRTRARTGTAGTVHIPSPELPASTEGC